MYLNCKTYYSFKYGTFSPAELVQEAVDKGVPSIALTNINNTCDLWEFVARCKESGITPVGGVEIRNGDHFLYLLLARNNQGLFLINRFLSEHLSEKKLFPPRPKFDDSVWIIFPLNAHAPDDLVANEIIGVQPNELNKLFRVPVQDHADRFVIRQPVTVRNKTYYQLHRLLRAIDKNILESQLQEKDVAAQHEFFVSPGKLLQRFENFPTIIANTHRVIDSCNLSMDFHSDKTKKLYTSSAEDDRKLLERLAITGMNKRYGAKNKEAKARIANELAIINDSGFNAYFLMTWDVVRYGKSCGFFHVGRGSGANSIVSYCLGITEVDPIELNLYFERFLNPYRTSPPDFDIDYSWKDRDEIIHYIFDRYGHENVSLLGSFVTFQARAVIRELGKVYGLPKEEIDRLANYKQAADQIHYQILEFGQLLKSFPNYLSIHAGGMLISQEPIHTYTATELPPKNFSTSQIDMHIAEEIGLFKLDILSQRGLGHIKDAIELVEQNKGVSINIHAVEKFKKDPKINAQLRSGDTIGCFYIESPGMRQLLQKLSCSEYPTLVAASSVIRPGVSQSGMMEEYIKRHHNRKNYECIHPVMKALLPETYGLMIYQEDVIKVSLEFAGLDAGKCDLIRRGMSGKTRGYNAFREVQADFFNGAKAKGHEEAVINEVWRQLSSFGGYSFSKAHSASFAVESYQSLYLKTYFPMEFMVSVIKNFGGYYSRELYFHELKRTGANVYPPCVNSSDYMTNIKGTDVWTGFVHIQGLQENFAMQILRDRARSGPYHHLLDFIERTQPALEQLNLLIRVDAFRFTGIAKPALLWEAAYLLRHAKHHSAGELFHEAPPEFDLPHLIHDKFDYMIDQVELLGFTLGNVFDMVDHELNVTVKARELSSHVGEEVDVLVYLITIKDSWTKHNQLMHFGTFIDETGDWMDTIHFPDVAAKYPFTGKGFYKIRGKVTVSFGVPSIEAHSCEKIGIKENLSQVTEILKSDQSYRAMEQRA